MGMPNIQNWSAAMDYCSFLDWDGGGWRLPTITELRSLVRECSGMELNGNCAVNDPACLLLECAAIGCDGCSYNEGPSNGCYMPVEMQLDCISNKPVGWLWSSSPVGEQPDLHWGLAPAVAKVDALGGSGLGRGVRCVR